MIHSLFLFGIYSGNPVLESSIISYQNPPIGKENGNKDTHNKT